MGFSNGRGSGASDVAHAWANQTKSHMSKGNVFFEGDVIYSYGYHFPMARLYKRAADATCVFVSTRTYSPSTSTHQSRMRQAISHHHELPCHYVPTAKDPRKDCDAHEKNFDHWADQIEGTFTELSNPKIRNRSERFGLIERYKDEALSYADVLNLKISGRLKTALKITSADEFKKKLEAEEKKQQRELTKRQKNAEPHYWENLEAWKEFEDRIHPTTPEMSDFQRTLNITHLRASLINVETSKGVRIPVDIAKRYYDKYLSIVSRGGCVNAEQCKFKMLDFEVTEMNQNYLIVGCHRIPRMEIDYIAKKLNWIKQKQTA